MADYVYIHVQGGRLMEWILIIFGSVLAGSALVTITAITVQDMRIAKLSQFIKNNPKLERLKRRPLISIIIDEEPTDESIISLRHGNYRKIEIVYSGEKTHGDLMLPINPDTIIEKSLLSKAINRFNTNPEIEAIEIIPQPEIPDNLRDLLHFYRQIVSAPFISVRAAFRVVPIWGSGWPVIINLHAKIPEWRARLYAILRWVIQTANAFVLVYAVTLAAIFRQTDVLVLYLGLFIIWLIAAIWMYPYFTLRQKIVSIFLAPVSFGYFFILGIVAPFTSLRSSSSDAFARLWRSSHSH